MLTECRQDLEKAVIPSYRNEREAWRATSLTRSPTQTGTVCFPLTRPGLVYSVQLISLHNTRPLLTIKFSLSDTRGCCHHTHEMRGIIHFRALSMFLTHHYCSNPVQKQHTCNFKLLQNRLHRDTWGHQAMSKSLRLTRTQDKED